MRLSENDSISLLKGIGQKKLASLNGMGICTVSDLLAFLPIAYKDRGRLKHYSECCEEQRTLIEAEYTGEGSAFRARSGSRCILKFKDGDDIFDVYFYNQPYIKSSLKVGSVYRLYGTFKTFNKKLILLAPQLERLDLLAYLNEGIYPVYPLSVKSGLKQKEIYRFILQALSVTEFTEDMPLWIINELLLKGKAESMTLVHAPCSAEEADLGTRYFKTLRFLRFYAFIDINKAGVKDAPGIAFDISCFERFKAKLPFKLTSSQQKAAGEILADMSGGLRMNRLLQGDVGSGKTAVAMAAAYTAAANGYQCAFTAPTEILAKQHYENYRDMLRLLGIESTLIYSSMKKSERAEADEAAASGRAGVVFGTHALFSKQTSYKKLGLIIIDEQHRYGVMQRASLEDKGAEPHVLVMSATPIPRTLSLCMYKDLNVSALTDKPAGRVPVKTLLINSSQTENAYDAVKRSAAKGLKTYIVCPAIDAEDLESVKTTLEEAVEALKPYKVLYLTGEMKETEKQRVMREFSGDEAHVLVATTVIEVGVDVSKAAIMWVRSAERFGLAQLHQLRGRVGRNEIKCYCFLQTDASDEKTARRLNVLKTTDDGFEIARQDLKLRGAGEVYGVRQSGKGGGILQEAMDYPELFTACDAICAQIKLSQRKRDMQFYEMLCAESGGESIKIAFN